MRIYLRKPLKYGQYEMLLPVEIHKNVANNLETLQAVIGRVLGLDLYGWQLYVDLQPVTIF